MTDEAKPKKGFFARNKKLIFTLLGVYVLLMLLLILFTDNSLMPFVYQFG